jgi:hypothetical protein
MKERVWEEQIEVSGRRDGEGNDEGRKEGKKRVRKWTYRAGRTA